MAKAEREPIPEPVLRAFRGEPDGVMHLHISITVSAADMAKWPPDAVRMFFEGIGRCIVAEQAPPSTVEQQEDR